MPNPELLVSVCPTILNFLYFTESLDDTKVIRKYPDLALKPANPELLVFACSHNVRRKDIRISKLELEL